MKYIIKNNIIQFRTTVCRPQFKLNQSAFREAPGAELIEITLRNKVILYATTMKVLTSVTEEVGKEYYIVPSYIFKERLNE